MGGRGRAAGAIQLAPSRRLPSEPSLPTPHPTATTHLHSRPPAAQPHCRRQPPPDTMTRASALGWVLALTLACTVIAAPAPAPAPAEGAGQGGSGRAGVAGPAGALAHPAPAHTLRWVRACQDWRAQHAGACRRGAAATAAVAAGSGHLASAAARCPSAPLCRRQTGPTSGSTPRWRWQTRSGAASQARATCASGPGLDDLLSCPPQLPAATLAPSTRWRPHPGPPTSPPAPAQCFTNTALAFNTTDVSFIGKEQTARTGSVEQAWCGTPASPAPASLACTQQLHNDKSGALGAAAVHAAHPSAARLRPRPPPSGTTSPGPAPPARPATRASRRCCSSSGWTAARAPGAASSCACWCAQGGARGRWVPPLLVLRTGPGGRRRQARLAQQACFVASPPARTDHQLPLPPAPRSTRGCRAGGASSWRTMRARATLWTLAAPATTRTTPLPVRRGSVALNVPAGGAAVT